MAWICKKCGHSYFGIKYTNEKDECEFDKEGNLEDYIEGSETILECCECGEYTFGEKIQNIANWED